MRLLVLFGLLFVLGAFQDPFNATIFGSIMDENDLPLMGVTVVVKHIPTNTFRGAITNLDGQYHLRNLRSGGPYTITLSFTGYKTLSKDSLLLEEGSKRSMDFKMAPM